MINVRNKHSKSFYICGNLSEGRKNTVKQTKYVNKVTNSENRIKTKWIFCTKKILRSRAQVIFSTWVASTPKTVAEAAKSFT